MAALLETSSASVTSALQRARERLRGRLPNGGSGASWVSPNNEAQRALLERYVRAWEEADLSALVALLRDDVVVSMPPDTLWFSGRETLASFLAATIFSGEARGRVRLLPAAANRQPGFAMYQRDEHGLYRALAIMVLRLDGEEIAEITGFMDASLFPRFGVEAVLRDCPTLPGAPAAPRGPSRSIASQPA